MDGAAPVFEVSLTDSCSGDLQGRGLVNCVRTSHTA